MKKQIANKNSTSKKKTVSSTDKKVSVKKVQDKTGPKKFKILELVDGLTHSEYKTMRRELPKKIGKCINTFDNYSYILIDSKEDIPYHVGLKIEKYFRKPPGYLSNLPIQ